MSKETKERVPSRKEMIRELKKAGFDLDAIKLMGVVGLYRFVLAQQHLGILDQMQILKCDADSQDPYGAIEDIKDLRRRR